MKAKETKANRKKTIKGLLKGNLIILYAEGRKNIKENKTIRVIRKAPSSIYLIGVRIGIGPLALSKKVRGKFRKGRMKRIRIRNPFSHLLT